MGAAEGARHAEVQIPRRHHGSVPESCGGIEAACNDGAGEDQALKDILAAVEAFEQAAKTGDISAVIALGFTPERAASMLAAIKANRER